MVMSIVVSSVPQLPVFGDVSIVNDLTMFASFIGTCSEGDPYIRRIDSLSSFSFAFMNS